MRDLLLWYVRSCFSGWKFVNSISATASCTVRIKLSPGRLRSPSISSLNTVTHLYTVEIDNIDLG